MPLKTLAGFLSVPLGAPVLDETGLTGDYDFSLDSCPTSGGADFNQELYPKGPSPFPTFSSRSKINWA
jgi:uncharacterized protein (TIGR03435 family)